MSLKVCGKEKMRWFTQTNFLTQTNSFKKARNDYIDYMQAISSQESTLAISSNQSVSQWKKPLSGMWKLNWDAACNYKVKKLGLGAIVHDENG